MRILIVEDEAGIAAFLKQGLEEEQFEVKVASTGIQGMEIALSEDFDLLILDWMLPGKTGIEICQEFRKSNTKTPILFLTAKDTVNETITGLQSGANDYVKKPFHFDELLARIHAHLRLNQKQKIIKLGAITLDISTHVVTKNEKEISLTQKEFALLQMLIENKDQVCTRTQIIEQVWDIHFDYNTGVIDVFISALRKKLELTETENYIQNIRGIGYIAKEI
jgi:two-component system, OmpR family, copper resistance phosphate regulon response regulator CusR